MPPAPDPAVAGGGRRPRRGGRGGRSPTATHTTVRTIGRSSGQACSPANGRAFWAQPSGDSQESAPSPTSPTARTTNAAASRAAGDARRDAGVLADLGGDRRDPGERDARRGRGTQPTVAAPSAGRPRATSPPATRTPTTTSMPATTSERSDERGAAADGGASARARGDPLSSSPRVRRARRQQAHQGHADGAEHHDLEGDLPSLGRQGERRALERPGDRAVGGGRGGTVEVGLRRVQPLDARGRRHHEPGERRRPTRRGASGRAGTSRADATCDRAA